MVNTDKQCQRRIDWNLFLSYIKKDEYVQLISEIDALCQSAGCNAYIVGGAVRDYFLGMDSCDMDIVIEGNGMIFAKSLGEKLNYIVKTYEPFLTATMQLPSGQKIDFITSRKEVYLKPAALPIIIPAGLIEDLKRRDFSINSLAIQLNGRDKGRFYDLFGGLQDLKDKKIRILHDDSFLDDPTRIFRAVRYAVRLDFKIEKHTKSLIAKALAEKAVASLSSERLSNSFLSVLSEEKTAICMEELNRLGVLAEIFLQGSFSINELRKMDDDKIIRYNVLFESPGISCDLVLLKLLLFFFPCSLSDWQSIKLVLSFDKKYSHCVLQMIEYREKFRDTLQQSHLSPAEVYQLLQPLYIEVILCLLLACDHLQIERYCMMFLLDSQHIKLHVTGKDLLNLGIKPGEIYGIILKQVLAAKLDHKIVTYEDEIAYVRSLLENKFYQDLSE